MFGEPLGVVLGDATLISVSVAIIGVVIVAHRQKIRDFILSLLGLKRSTEKAPSQRWHCNVGSSQGSSRDDNSNVSDGIIDNDPELWRPRLREDCPICMIPLPYDATTYFSCCGKYMCNACSHERDRATIILNAKREKRELPPLDTCGFCRTSAINFDEQKSLEKRAASGDPLAMYNLAKDYIDRSDEMPGETLDPLILLQRSADLGCADAYEALGKAYAFGGLDVYDRDKGRDYLEEAVKRGSIRARFHLGIYWTKSGHCKTAVRHFRLAAAAGFDDAVQELWKCFHKGKLSKPDLEEALREHQQASDEMKSEERERYRALENALDGDDQILTKFYSSYYQGELSSKELNRALEAYKSNSSEVDLGVVRMLQPIFAPLVGNASEQDLKKFLEVHRAKMRTRKRRG